MVGSQAAWFACVLGAAYGAPWVGVLATILWVLIWGWERQRWRGDLQLLGAVGLLGYLVDSGLVMVGALRFPDHAWLGGPAPLWMVALWVGFGTSLRALGPRVSWSVAVLLGAAAGPLAYNGGVVFGAASFGDDGLMSRVVIGAVWAAVMPALVWLERRF